MRKTLAASVAVALLTLAVPVSASAECPDPNRPHHVLPYCFSSEELAVFLSTQAKETAVAPLPVSLEGQVRVIASHFWPAWAVDRMVRIAKCESNYIPTSVNGRSGATGIWQIMPFWQRAWPGDYKNPWTNGAVAYQIWLVQGFGAWVCKG